MSSLPGAAVWLGVAVALGGWLVASALLRGRGAPTIVDVVHWWLESWAGRIVVLGAWAIVGYHVLTQRP